MESQDRVGSPSQAVKLWIEGGKLGTYGANVLFLLGSFVCVHPYSWSGKSKTKESYLINLKGGGGRSFKFTNLLLKVAVIWKGWVMPSKCRQWVMSRCWNLVNARIWSFYSLASWLRRETYLTGVEKILKRSEEAVVTEMKNYLLVSKWQKKVNASSRPKSLFGFFIYL